MFDGVVLLGGAASEDEEGWRVCELLGDEGLDTGADGWERKARCACSVGVRRVVAKPERCREGRCSREYSR